MKKAISKIMLGLSLLFLAGDIFLIAGVLTNNLRWNENQMMTVLVLLALSGLFLALYRIISLLEEKS